MPNDVHSLSHTKWNCKYHILLEDDSASIVEYNGEDTVLVIPEELDGHTVTSLGLDIFYNCDSIEEYHVFYWGFSSDTITEIIIPDSVTFIGDIVFCLCNALTEIFIPNSVTSMGINPFLNCENLTAIHVSPDHPTLASIDGVLIDKKEQWLICYPQGLDAKSYSIPEGVSIIGAEAFFSVRS